MENRLCLGVLIGRQRFRTLEKSFVTTAIFRSIPLERATGPAIMLSGGGEHGDTGTVAAAKP